MGNSGISTTAGIQDMCLTPLNAVKACGGNTATPVGPEIDRNRGYPSSPNTARGPIVRSGNLPPRCAQIEDPDTAVSHGEERSGDPALRSAQDDEWAFRSRIDNPLVGNAERVNPTPREISVLARAVADVAGDSKYHVAVNSLTSVLTVRWKHAERGSRLGRFIRSENTIGSTGFGKFRAGSSSSLSLHSYAECV